TESSSLGCDGAGSATRPVLRILRHKLNTLCSQFLFGGERSPCRSAGPRYGRVTAAHALADAPGLRRSSSSSACPDSTLVRIVRATANSSATCGLVNE